MGLYSGMVLEMALLERAEPVPDLLGGIGRRLGVLREIVLRGGDELGLPLVVDLLGLRVGFLRRGIRRLELGVGAGDALLASALDAGLDRQHPRLQLLAAEPRRGLVRR